MDLTHQLKLVSIPVAVAEESWTERFARVETSDVEPRAAITCKSASIVYCRVMSSK